RRVAVALAQPTLFAGFLHFIKETEFDNHNFFSGAKRILQEILDAATMKEMVARYAVLFEINAGAAPIALYLALDFGASLSCYNYRILDAKTYRIAHVCIITELIAHVCIITCDFFFIASSRFFGANLLNAD
ncbi:hypothetical protein ACJX0J_015151, partial [Zea mays]